MGKYYWFQVINGKHNAMETKVGEWREREIGMESSGNNWNKFKVRQGGGKRKGGAKKGKKRGGKERHMHGGCT